MGDPPTGVSTWPLTDFNDPVNCVPVEPVGGGGVRWPTDRPRGTSRGVTKSPKRKRR